MAVTDACHFVLVLRIVLKPVCRRPPRLGHLHRQADRFDLIVVRAVRELFERMYRIKGIGILGATIMFCPKCGLQNADETKFCRGCGTELTNVLAAVDGKLPGAGTLPERYIEIRSRGIRGLLIGLGLLIVSGISFALPLRFAVLGLFSLAFASIFLGVGISRLIQAGGIRKLVSKDEPAALQPGQPGYIEPSRSAYQTNDLAPPPLSVTEHTTIHLKLEDDNGTISK